MTFVQSPADAGPEADLPTVRNLTTADLRIALQQGIDDFLAMPTHAIFLCVIYPVVGLVLARLTLGYAVLPLQFPLAAGFALLGPLAAIGLYELSRRREKGLDLAASHALDIFRSPSIGAIAILGVALTALFVIWVAAAQAIYISFFGNTPAASMPDFAHQVFTTRAGLGLILVGNAVGFVFAVVALAASVVSFPLLLDRNVGAATAVVTSLRVVAKNPVNMSLWGLLVAAALVVGSLPFFLGLAVVLPVLGHATWHLYRRAVG